MGDPDATPSAAPQASEAPDTPATRPAKRRRTSTVPTPTPAPVVINLLEEGEVSPAAPGDDAPEEGEVTMASERAAIDTHVGASLRAHAGSTGVSQREARYYLAKDVVCELCGVKGHMSFDCDETPEEPRCNLCGTPGCRSLSCPRFRADARREAQQHLLRFDRAAPTGEVRLSCYVCGAGDHLDCAVGTLDRTGTLSCYNCGAAGHAGHGCNLAAAEQTLIVANDMLSKRRRNFDGGRGGRGGRGGGRGGKAGAKAWKEKDRDEFHNALLAGMHERRYKGGYRG